MARVMITEQYLEDIADAIRAKLGGSDTYSPGEMATAISLIDGGSPTIDSLSVTPSTSEQTFNSSSVDGYKPVVVGAMPSITLPTTTSNSSSGTSKATLTLTGGTKYLNIPTGYNSAAQYYTLSVASGSATGPSSLSGTSATVSTGTNTLTLTKTGVSTTPTVTAGYVSSATSSTATVALTASVTTKGATTYTPGTTNQTIASGTYLTGAQTISGDANLIAGNIKKDVTIFGTTGTYDAGGGGSSLNTQVLQQGATRVAGTSYAKACGDLTVSVAGTYDVYWTTYRTSTSGTWGTRLYKNSSALSEEQTTFSSYYQTVKLTGQVFAKNDVLSVYAKTRGSSYYAYVGQLTIVQTS